MFSFNENGWFIDTIISNRHTEIEPLNKSTTEINGELRSNFTGYAWVEVPYFANIEEISKEIPQSVTPRQARLALLQATLLDEVELLLANDKAMQIWWEYSLEIERNHTYIEAMATALGLTTTQLDDLFILANTL